MLIKAWINIIFALTIFCSLPVVAKDAQFHTQGEKVMLKTESKMMIENFYKYFNASDLEKLFSIISNDITHEINHAGVMQGKDEAIKYFKHSKEHYEEHVRDCVFMISDDGRHVTTKFTVNGKYIKTDESLIPAKGQNYVLTVFNYFEIENNQIIKAECFFDEKDLTRQLTQSRT